MSIKRFDSSLHQLKLTAVRRRCSTIYNWKTKCWIESWTKLREEQNRTCRTWQAEEKKVENWAEENSEQAGRTENGADENQLDATKKRAQTFAIFQLGLGRTPNTASSSSPFFTYLFWTMPYMIDYICAVRRTGHNEKGFEASQFSLKCRTTTCLGYKSILKLVTYWCEGKLHIDQSLNQGY